LTRRHLRCRLGVQAIPGSEQFQPPTGRSVGAIGAWPIAQLRRPGSCDPTCQTWPLAPWTTPERTTPGKTGKYANYQQALDAFRVARPRIWLADPTDGNLHNTIHS
jgi:hypothetical protein